MFARKSSILVIDDDEVTLRLLGVMLKSRGFTVLLSRDAADGLEKAAANRPDLIILDVFMPVMDGWDVLSQLRSQTDTEHTPVIMLTSADQLKNAERAFSLGANGYLSKPINPVLLNKKLAQLINGKS